MEWGHLAFRKKNIHVKYSVTHIAQNQKNINRLRNESMNYLVGYSIK